MNIRDGQVSEIDDLPYGGRSGSPIKYGSAKCGM